MSTDSDLTIRSDEESARYNRMKDAIFGGDYYDDTIPTMAIAAVLFLDEDAGVHLEDDRIVMVPGFAMWLPAMVTFVDPDLAALVTEEDRELTEAEAEAIEARTRDWFQVKFDMAEVEYPSNIAGKTIWFKVVDDDKLDDCFCATVRASDGTIVKLPEQMDTRRF